MPPKKPLPAEEKAILKVWIATGAVWGTDPIDPLRTTTKERAGFDWWSLKPIVRPAGYKGKILYEGELGVVIGKKCANITEAEAKDYIFGYTCVNDVTGLDVLRKNPSFEQWVQIGRAHV